MVLTPDTAKLRFGHALRQYRERAGLTQTQLAKAALVSQAMLSAIERGVKTTRREHVERIDEVLTTSGGLLQMWDSLFSPSGLSSYFRDVAELEREAVEIRQYQLALVPGLLQTQSYARAITRIGQPTYTEPEVETQVTARLQRQSVLEQERGPLYRVVLDETALHRRVGGRETMREQLEHLVKVSQWTRVTLQVIPVTADPHSGLDGPFQLLTVPDKGDILYTETLVSGTASSDAEAIAEYSRVFGDLRGAALPSAASRELIEQVLGDLK